MALQKIMKFEKVSFEQYLKDFIKCLKVDSTIYNSSYFEEKIRYIWENIKLPKRATNGSAGYDFYAPFDIPATYDDVIIPTGIRCNLSEGWVLLLAPRSSNGFKYRMTLANTIGVIDSDYYYGDNEGHIMAKFGSEKPFEIKNGDRFIQGFATVFGISEDDEPISEERNGGFGSTGKN